MMTRSRRPLVFLPFVVVSALHVVLLVLQGFAVDNGSGHIAVWATVSKGLLMPALLGAFLVALLAAGPVPGRGGRSRSRAAVVTVGAALVFSWLGDISLSVTDGPGFLLGLGFFLVAHLAWIATFVRVLGVRRPPRAALVYLLWLVAFVLLLAPHTSALLLPVVVYGAVLALVAALGLGAGRRVAWGTALFLASDSLLGLLTFYPGFSLWQVDALIMTGYLAGQALMVLGVLHHLAALEKPAPVTNTRPEGTPR